MPTMAECFFLLSRRQVWKKQTKHKNTKERTLLHQIHLAVPKHVLKVLDGVCSGHFSGLLVEELVDLDSRRGATLRCVLPLERRRAVTEDSAEAHRQVRSPKEKQEPGRERQKKQKNK